MYLTRTTPDSERCPSRNAVLHVAAADEATLHVVLASTPWWSARSIARPARSRALRFVIFGIGQRSAFEQVLSTFTVGALCIPCGQASSTRTVAASFA